MLVRLSAALILVASGCGGDAPSGDEARAIEVVREAGGDPGRPRPIDYFLYFPAREQAEGAARDLREEGFDASVERAADSANEWLVLATKTGVLTRDLTSTQDHLRALADRHGGEYDGWDAPTSP
jgi:hypothetical protein